MEGRHARRLGSAQRSVGVLHEALEGLENFVNVLEECRLLAGASVLSVGLLPRHRYEPEQVNSDLERGTQLLRRVAVGRRREEPYVRLHEARGRHGELQSRFGVLVDQRREFEAAVVHYPQDIDEVVENQIFVLLTAGTVDQNLEERVEHFRQKLDDLDLGNKGEPPQQAGQAARGLISPLEQAEE